MHNLHFTHLQFTAQEVTPICAVLTAKTGHLDPICQGRGRVDRFLPYIIGSKDLMCM